MYRPASLRFVLAAAAAITLVASASTYAENQKAAPATTIPQPTSGPADPKLRAIQLPNGKTMHLLPATLETT